MDGQTIKVLYVNGGTMDRGGVSSVMMNYYLHIDPQVVEIDFMVHGDKVSDRDEEIIQRGSKIFRVVPKSKNILRNYFQIKKILKKERYDIIHAHADSGNGFILKIAKECNVNIRISHSHNTEYTITNKIRIFLNNLQKKQIAKYATHLWACSKIAGEWLYGKKEKFVVIKNAIDVDNFLFSKDDRNQIRKKYKIHNEIVIGMVGRLDYQKNHRYAIEIFRRLLQKDSNFKLLFIGEGILKKNLQETVMEFGLQKDVIFTGQVTDIEKYYSAMDVLIMPSLFEGLPVSVVEAQCSGLTCILSTAITDEVKVTDNVRYFPTTDEAINEWIQDILKVETRIRTEKINKIRESGFDIRQEALNLQNSYIALLKKQVF